MALFPPISGLLFITVSVPLIVTYMKRLIVGSDDKVQQEEATPSKQPKDPPVIKPKPAIRQKAQIQAPAASKPPQINPTKGNAYPDIIVITSSSEDDEHDEASDNAQKREKPSKAALSNQGESESDGAGWGDPAIASKASHANGVDAPPPHPTTAKTRQSRAAKVESSDRREKRNQSGEMMSPLRKKSRVPEDEQQKSSTKRIMSSASQRRQARPRHSQQQQQHAVTPGGNSDFDAKQPFDFKMTPTQQCEHAYQAATLASLARSNSPLTFTPELHAQQLISNNAAANDSDSSARNRSCSVCESHGAAPRAAAAPSDGNASS